MLLLRNPDGIAEFGHLLTRWDPTLQFYINLISSTARSLFQNCALKANVDDDESGKCERNHSQAETRDGTSRYTDDKGVRDCGIDTASAPRGWIDEPAQTTGGIIRWIANWRHWMPDHKRGGLWRKPTYLAQDLIILTIQRDELHDQCKVIDGDIFLWDRLFFIHLSRRLRFLCV